MFVKIDTQTLSQFWNIVIGMDSNRSLSCNFVGVLGMMDSQSIKSEEMKMYIDFRNIYILGCLACIDDGELSDDSQNQNNIFFTIVETCRTQIITTIWKCD